MSFFLRNLPRDILLNVCSYDNTYKKLFNKCIADIQEFSSIKENFIAQIDVYKKGHIKFFIDFKKERANVSSYNKKIIEYNLDNKNMFKLNKIRVLTVFSERFFEVMVGSFPVNTKEHKKDIRNFNKMKKSLNKKKKYMSLNKLKMEYKLDNINLYTDRLSDIYCY